MQFNRYLQFLFCFFLLVAVNKAQAPVANLQTILEKEEKQKFGLVIHGGAGTILKTNMTSEMETAYKETLNTALNAGYSILANGGKALDAVEAAIKVLENSPLFNAGKGSVFSNAGKNEMDAAIMDGSNLKAGSMAGVQTIKNPISGARAVMEKSEHVMLSGEGAEKFAKLSGLEIVDQKYFYDEKRWQQFQNVLKAEQSQQKQVKDIDPNIKDKKHGTVGCVALDMAGNLAAGTSTGGMTNKKYGRIGDAPIIGAGTYANNATCAVSCTGHGEYFIRYTVANNVSAMMEYGGKNLKEAADIMIHSKLVSAKGEGGLIAIDKDGNITMPFNSAGMYRAYKLNDERFQILIYKE